MALEITRSIKRKAGLDMTPLVDIVFQLVIFFMLTTSFVPAESLEIFLPSAEAKPAVQLQDMRIQIASSGHVTIDGEAVGRQQLEDALYLRVAKNDALRIGVFSTPGVSVQQLVSVMDMVYRAGGRNVYVDRMEYGGVL